MLTLIGMERTTHSPGDSKMIEWENVTPDCNWPLWTARIEPFELFVEVEDQTSEVFRWEIYRGFYLISRGRCSDLEKAKEAAAQETRAWIEAALPGHTHQSTAR